MARMADLDWHRPALLIASRRGLPARSLRKGPLMPKMANARKGHCHILLIGGRDNLGIIDRYPRLNGGAGPGLGGGDQPVRKREKCVAANRASLQGQSRLLRFPDGDLARVHPAHLSSAHAQSSIAP